MIYEVITTNQADVDLRGIYEYIAFELLSVRVKKNESYNYFRIAY